MSDAKKPEEGEVAPPKAKSKLLLFIGIGVIVLALIAGGAAFLLMKKKPADDEDAEAEVAEETHDAGKGDKKHPPVFVKLEVFTVRLQNEGQDSYLQATPELRVLDAQVGEMVKQYNPEIRHKSLLVMAAKTPQELNTPAGVEQLANELRHTINRIVAPPPPKKKGKNKEVSEEISDHAAPGDPVQAVLFTTFIVQ